ncbi:hypothetical protein L1F06_015530 [Ectopseudomonas hydrolytica]|jgi:hypothetical protein|uniref:Uncharacterized protein n=1 Tax=Ectopseudomonas hydrolytica TaxID=2493633 RepID=A0ABY5A319_9GAMM|nr:MULTISPECIES: hypothetical protein [Pseudomonas]USR38081.1 hypothetical protein L1F06_015530 [Pseudomonas hydrolytica]
MSTIIQFPSIRPAVNCIALAGEPEYVTVVEYGEQLFVTDRQLGLALGYVEPLAAIEQLCAKNGDELGSFLIDLHQAEPEGRTRVRVFDLEGAMRICKLARTPAAAMLYARLGGRAIAEFVVVDAGPKAQVLPFPKRKKARKPGKGRRHG